MTRIKMIGLAITAVFAVFAVASVSAVAAAENPVLVNSSGGAVSNIKVTGKDNTVSFLQSTEVGGPKVECATETSAGTLSTTTAGTGMTSGSGTVTFKECKSGAGKCTNTAASNELTGTVSILLVWVGEERNKTIGVLISILPYSGLPGPQNGLLSFKCSGKLVDVQGSFIALTNRKIGELFTTLVTKAELSPSAGIQKDLTYTENGITGTNTLYSINVSGNGGTTTFQSGEEIEPEETYETSVKVIEN